MTANAPRPKETVIQTVIRNATKLADLPTVVSDLLELDERGQLVLRDGVTIEDVVDAVLIAGQPVYDDDNEGGETDG